jgi:hypothetical protein
MGEKGESERPDTEEGDATEEGAAGSTTHATKQKAPPSTYHHSELTY